MFLVSALFKKKLKQRRKKVKKQIQSQSRKKPKIFSTIAIHNFQTRISPEIQTNAREKMLKNRLRLSRLTELHRLSIKNLSARPVRLFENFLIDDFAKNILKKKDSVCQKREKRRKAIMSKTRGKGMSVKKAEWTSDSFVRCKG